MSESKFTPGPWRIEHSLECVYVRADCPVCAAKGLKEPIGIAQMFNTGSGDDHDEHEMANAALIAAAPTMAAYIERKALDGDADAIALWETINAG